MAKNKRRKKLKKLKKLKHLKTTRFKMLSKHDVFNTCKCCGFIWLPMNSYSVTNCPKCSPSSNKMIIDDDVEYLMCELKTSEIISHDMIDYPEPHLAG